MSEDDKNLMQDIITGFKLISKKLMQMTEIRLRYVLENEIMENRNTQGAELMEALKENEERLNKILDHCAGRRHTEDASTTTEENTHANCNCNNDDDDDADDKPPKLPINPMSGGRYWW